MTRQRRILRTLDHLFDQCRVRLRPRFDDRIGGRSVTCIASHDGYGAVSRLEAHDRAPVGAMSGRTGDEVAIRERVVESGIASTNFRQASRVEQSMHRRFIVSLREIDWPGTFQADDRNRAAGARTRPRRTGTRPSSNWKCATTRRATGTARTSGNRANSRSERCVTIPYFFATPPTCLHRHN